MKAKVTWLELADALGEISVPLGINLGDSIYEEDVSEAERHRSTKLSHFIDKAKAESILHDLCHATILNLKKRATSRISYICRYDMDYQTSDGHEVLTCAVEILTARSLGLNIPLKRLAFYSSKNMLLLSFEDTKTQIAHCMTTSMPTPHVKRIIATLSAQLGRKL